MEAFISEEKIFKYFIHKANLNNYQLAKYLLQFPFYDTEGFLIIF